MLMFAKNMPTPRHQVRPPIQTTMGQFGAIQQNIRAITSPINTSGAASNAAYANGNDPSDPTSNVAPAQTSSMPTPQPLPPIGRHHHHHGGGAIGLTPLGWGVVFVSAFAIYKTFIAR